MKKEHQYMEDKLRSASIIKEDEEIVGVIDEVFYGSTLQQREELAENTSHEDRVIPVESVEMYEIIAEMGPDTLRREEAMVSTKYKTVEKKVKPAAGPLPPTANKRGTKFQEIRHSGRPWISGIPSRMILARNFGSEEADSSCRKKKNDSGRC
jgi:hypothetical protein